MLVTNGNNHNLGGHHTQCSCQVTCPFLLPTFPSPGCPYPETFILLPESAWPPAGVRTGELMPSRASCFPPGTARKIVYRYPSPITHTWGDTHLLHPLWLPRLLSRTGPHTTVVACLVPTWYTLLTSLPTLHMEFLGISTLLTNP